MVDKRFNELQRDIDALLNAINQHELNENWDEVVSCKRELYKLKLDQLDIVDSEAAIASTRSARQLRQEVQSRPKVPRYETGIHCLDRELKGGIEVGTFIQIAGESFAGKTHIVLEILSNISRYAEVLFFNFEMGDIRADERLGRLLETEKQWDNFLVNSKARKLGDITKEIRSKAKDGIKFFAIDSKMKIEVPEAQDDFKAFGKISNELAKLAQQEDIIVMLINQMNEEDQKSGRLAFKGSGDQMYDADIALFYMIDKDKKLPPEQWKRTIVCRKNRQDERLFRVGTQLDARGRTIEQGMMIAQEYVYKPEPASMPTI